MRLIGSYNYSLLLSFIVISINISCQSRKTIKDNITSFYEIDKKVTLDTFHNILNIDIIHEDSLRNKLDLGILNSKKESVIMTFNLKNKTGKDINILYLSSNSGYFAPLTRVKSMRKGEEKTVNYILATNIKRKCTLMVVIKYSINSIQTKVYTFSKSYTIKIN